MFLATTCFEALTKFTSASQLDAATPLQANERSSPTAAVRAPLTGPACQAAIRLMTSTPLPTGQYVPNY